MGEWFHADEPGPGKSRKGRTPRRGGQVEGMAERGWVCLPRGVKAAGGDRALGSGEPAGWLSRRGLFEAVCTMGQGIALLCLSNLLQKLPKQLPAQPLGELSLDPPPTPSTCHPRSHLCAASLPSEAVSPEGQGCASLPFTSPQPPLPWEAGPASFSLQADPWGGTQVPFPPTVPSKIPISGSWHLLHFYDQSSCPSRMFSIPGS